MTKKREDFSIVEEEEEGEEEEEEEEEYDNRICFLICSRMRSEGFPFIVGGLGVGAVFAWLASCRRLSSFVVVVASQIRGHWGKLLQGTFHGCVTCQFAPVLHCDLHENDMSRKKRDAFRCTGAVLCEMRSSIGISVWRVVFLGCWMWPCHWDLRFRVWHRSSVFVTSLS